MKEYRVSSVEAKNLTSREIIDTVLFRIAEDSPPYTDDVEMNVLFRGLNPVVAAVFSAWMATGFIANGGLFHMFDACCAEMLSRAAHGFRLLGKDDVAYAVE